MSVIEIKDRDDLRVGDTATFTYRGHEFTGPLWSSGPGHLGLGITSLRAGGGSWYAAFDFVRATREMPPLPTEPGSVIYVTECRGERADEPVIAVRAGDGEWVTPAEFFAGCLWHRPDHFTEWAPAKVVPA